MLALVNGGGTFDSAIGGTFQSDTDGTFHSDIPGTFESDMDGTFKVLQSIDDRYHKKSLILSSQLAVSDWYSIFSNEMLAEACLDRIVHKAIRFTLKGDSMRKKY